MRRIDLTPYTVSTQIAGKTAEQTYDVKFSLRVLLFNPQLQLSAKDLLLNHDLGEKIRDCEDSSILLEDAEWERINNAVDRVKGFQEHDVEFIHRVLDAPGAVHLAKPKETENGS